MRTRSIIAVLSPPSTAVDWMVVLFVVLLAAACSDGSGTGGSPSDAADAADTASAADTATADTDGADTTAADTTVADTATDDAVDSAGDVTDVADTAQADTEPADTEPADTEPADTKVPFPNACVCTASACGGGAIGGDQGDVMTDISDDAVAKSFKPNPTSGWTCLVPTLIQKGTTGTLACFCATSCGNGGIGGDAGLIHTGLEQADVDKSYGGGKPDNATGWLCGKDRGGYGQ